MSEAVQWLLKAIPTYLLTFGRIFVAPKTEIIEKCKGGESAVPGALAFLAVSMLILYGFEGSKDSQSDFWTTVIIWIVDAHRDDGKRFVVRADEILTAFQGLESNVLRLVKLFESVVVLMPFD